MFTDKLWKLIPTLKHTNIYIPDIKDSGLVYNKLFGMKSEFESLRYEFKLPVPM